MLPANRRLSAQVAVISTCKNEGQNAAEWITSLAKQTFRPAEVIVVDGGSTDGTPEIMEAEAKKHHLPLKVFHKTDINIAQGRNLAIAEASSPLIASLDFGCRPQPDWLEKLITPFHVDPRTEIVAGWYRAVDPKGRTSRFPGWPRLDQISPQSFIPSSRSLAFTKESWEKVNGYPEWLTLTGEDTFFALEAKRLCKHWAFVPDAVVEWGAPRSWYAFWEKANMWARGDGEIGYNAWLFRQMLRKIFVQSFLLVAGMLIICFLLFWAARNKPIYFAGGVSALILSVLVGALFSRVKWDDPLYLPGMWGLNLARLWGFWNGARQRYRVDLRRLKNCAGIFFILAGPPLADTGGGSRATQLALELLRRHYWVVYIHRYPSYETSQPAMSIAHSNLHQFSLPSFDGEGFLKKYQEALASLKKFVLIEYPSPDFLPLVNLLKQKGGKLIYDMIDDWNTTLGANWYSPEIEKRIVLSSDILVGTVPALQERLTHWSHGKDAHLLPNAVNRYLFDPYRYYQRPDDLPKAEWIGMYIGALWGDWFDWELLIATAKRYPQAGIVVIGDYRGQCPEPLPNLHFLGLRSQRSLPAYLAYADVAIIPWKVNRITQATSPLKLYEYLAMHRPVVAPDLTHLRNIPGVFLAHGPEEFIALVDQARQLPLDIENIEHFIGQNTWESRVTQLLQWIGENKL